MLIRVSTKSSEYGSRAGEDMELLSHKGSNLENTIRNWVGKQCCGDVCEVEDCPLYMREYILPLQNNIRQLSCASRLRRSHAQGRLSVGRQSPCQAEAITSSSLVITSYSEINLQTTIPYCLPTTSCYASLCPVYAFCYGSRRTSIIYASCLSLLTSCLRVLSRFIDVLSTHPATVHPLYV